MTPADSTPGWLWAQQHADLPLLLPGGVPLYFQQIPPGTFLMGARGGDVEEEPRHRVQITELGYLATFPMTQAQYRALVAGAEPSLYKGELHPVETVSWDDAVAAAAALTARLAKQWHAAHPADLLREHFPTHAPHARLPTEAEWEYACRAGTTTEYYTGDGEGALREAGWFVGNSGSTTQPVGLLARNAFGLCDMHGNVWEWCADASGFDAYAKRPDEAQDPFVDKPSVPLRVLRGGSWFCTATGCRSAFRFTFRPGYRDRDRGFRLCLSSGPVETSQAQTSQHQRSRNLEPQTEGGGAAQEGDSGWGELKFPGSGRNFLPNPEAPSSGDS